MIPSDQRIKPDGHTGPEELAAAAFVKQWSGKSTPDTERTFADLKRDPEMASAARCVERVWEGIGQLANRAEFLVFREQALARARRANRLRWILPRTDLQRWWGRAASIGGLAIALAFTATLVQYEFSRGVYKTDVGEQRTIELSDHSRIALDSNTRIRATMTADARTIEISQGQAQFDVIHNPARPFKVIVGGHTIVDVGTVFAVEYVDQTLQVALIEGKVAVLTPHTAYPISTSSTSGSVPQMIELSAGEELRVTRSGNATVTPKADLVAATAWREGKVIFRAEPLAEAVRRLNRYSPVQLEIDGAVLSNLSISGIFEAGDSRAFLEAVQAYLPVVADYSQKNIIKLRMK